MNSLLAQNGLYDSSRQINHVVLLVVVLQEVLPVLEYMQSKDPGFRRDDVALGNEIRNFGKVSTGVYQGLRVTVIQVSTSIFVPGKGNSGYTQVSGICGVLGVLKDAPGSHFYNMDLVINFGTAGGFLGPDLAIGDAVLADSAVFVSSCVPIPRNHSTGQSMHLLC